MIRINKYFDCFQLKCACEGLKNHNIFDIKSYVKSFGMINV